MKKTITCICIIFIEALNCEAQNGANIWQLGIHTSVETYPKCAIDFNFGKADTFTLIRPMGFLSTNSSICDTAGNILFYTNGNVVFNRLNDTLANSKNFNSGYLTQFYGDDGLDLNQGVISIPLPDSPMKYVIFNVSGEQFMYQGLSYERPTYLRYSIADMTEFGGLGGIDSNKRKIKILNDTLILGCLTAVKQGDGADWWLIAHKFASNGLWKIIINSQGIKVGDLQNIGLYIQNDNTGQACFSPNGNWYAYVGPSDSIMMLKFDRCTGNFSDPILTTVHGNHLTVGCSFSPNSHYLYVSSFDSIWQFDMNSPDIVASKILVAKNDGFIDTLAGVNNFFSFHQIAPDNKIYICGWNSTFSLNVINEPDSDSVLSNVSQHSFVLPSDDNVSVPNLPNYDLGPLGNTIADAGPNDTIVKGQSVQLGIPTIAGVKYQWKLNPTLSDTTIAQPIASPDTTTTYYITFTDTSTFSSCNVSDDTVTVFVKIATSAHAHFEPSSSISVRVSPNPASHWLNIVYRSNDDAVFELYNQFGERVANVSLYHYFKNRMLDVSNLPDGMYNYKIEQRNQILQSGKLAVIK